MKALMQPLEPDSEDQQAESKLEPESKAQIQSAVEFQNLDDDEQPFINQTGSDKSKPTICICKNDKCLYCNKYWNCICCKCTVLSCSISCITISSILLSITLIILYLMGYLDSPPIKPQFCDDLTQECTTWNSTNWNYIVSKYVITNVLNQGSNIYGNMIDYCGIYNDPIYDQVIEDLANAKVELFDKDEQFALYINAYNILAIKVILDHPKSTSNNECPIWVDSITDITENSGLKSVWKIDAGTIDGQVYSLDNVEQDTLRKYWKDARVHSSIVCASLSCPNVRNEAYIGKNINQQLNDQFSEWMNNTSKGLAIIGDDNEILKLSKIFDWYSDDFKRNGSSVKEFVLKHIDHQSLKVQVENTASIDYFSYNWTLNIVPTNYTTI